MSQETDTGLKTPEQLSDVCIHLEDETIPPERLEARLNGTESDWAATREQKTDRSAEITSKTNISDPKREPETPSADARTEKETPSETKSGETKEKAESPSTEENPLPERPEKEPTVSRKGTDTSPETEGEEKSDTDSTQKTATKPSEDSEGTESSPKEPESTSADTTSSPTNISAETYTAELRELQKRTEEAEKKSDSLLFMDNLLKAVDLHNRLLREQTASLESFKAELSEESARQKTELEGDMKELRQGIVATILFYSECLSLKTNAIHTRMEESLDKLETNSDSLRGETGQLIAEDRAMICEIQSIVEKELTRAANETSDFVGKALEETVTHYTDEIKTSTKFLKKQVEERKKASRFEKVTDVLMRVICPILAAGTFVLACVVTCFL